MEWGSSHSSPIEVRIRKVADAAAKLTALGLRHGALLRSIALVPATTLLVLSISLAGRLIYPLVPDRLGGGEPKTVILGFTKDNAKTAAGLEFPLQPPAPVPAASATAEAADQSDGNASHPKPRTGQISNALCLLFEGEDTYLMELPSGAVLKVDRSLVAVVHVVLNPTNPC